jgi:hypothetical protein
MVKTSLGIRMVLTLALTQTLSPEERAFSWHILGLFDHVTTLSSHSLPRPFIFGSHEMA